MAIYQLNLTPNLRTEGCEGNLDTSLKNGKSLQRTGYIEVYNGTSRKIVVAADGAQFNDTITTVTNNPDVVAE